MPQSRFLLVAVPLLWLTGCGFLPASGPHASAILIGSSASVSTETKSTSYLTVNITDDLLHKLDLRQKSIDTNINWPVGGKPKAVNVDVGDTIMVTIYEAQSGGLFVPREAGVRPGNFISLPAQTIDGSGYITVPYIGLVQAAGKTTNSIAKSIAAGLADRAIEPQVVVSFQDRGGSEVSVIGDVRNPSRFALSFNEERVLDGLANAGGSSFPGYESWVTLHREGKEHTIKLDDLLLDPSKNIYLEPNDTLYLYREPETFSIYGASQFQGSFNFERRKIELSDAIAKAQGLNTFQADPSEIYVFRRERPDFLEITGQDVAPEISEQSTIPVIYKLNLRKGDGFFLAQKFQMQDDDIVYIANSESVEFSKFLNILNLQSSTTNVTRDAY